MSEFEGKKLLVLGGIKTECDIVRQAKKMGAYVIVADYDPNCPAKEVADELITISATDVDAIVKLCKEKHINGITTGFVDILMPPCYEACKRLGFPYYVTPKMLSMATNKIDFKETCEKYGIPVPKTYVVGGGIPANVYKDVCYPVFVKPLDASGSRGAGVCFNQNELEKQFVDALEYSLSGNAIVEDYIVGTEFLLDYIGVDGEFKLLSMFDRYMSPDRSSAVNYSNVCLCPSKQIDEYYKEMNPKIIKMFKELGFTDGLVFLQGHTDGNKITFYEMGCRLGGSFFNLEQAVLGLNPVEMIIRYALTGKMISSIDVINNRSADFKKTAMVVNYLLRGENDTVASIEGVDQVKAFDSFVALIQQRDVGYHIIKDRIVDKPILSFYMVSDSFKKICTDLDHMNEVIQVKNNKEESLLSTKYYSKDLRR